MNSLSSNNVLNISGYRIYSGHGFMLMQNTQMASVQGGAQLNMRLLAFFDNMLYRAEGFRCQVSALQPAQKTAGQIEKETNRSPQSSQRTLKKKILNNLCALRVLCGEILLGNGIGFHEVSYERCLWPKKRPV